MFFKTLQQRYAIFLKGYQPSAKNYFPHSWETASVCNASGIGTKLYYQIPELFLKGEANLKSVYSLSPELVRSW